MDTNDKIKIGAFLVITILVIIIVWRILGKIGLVKSKEQKKKESALADFQTNEYFDPLLYKGKSFKALGAEVAKKYARDIYDCKGVFNDNEDRVYSIFGSFKNKMNISEVAEQFGAIYRKDLKQFLASFLNDKEAAKLQDVINKLPNF